MPDKSYDSWKQKWEAFRQRQAEASVAHPFRSALPFLGITAVILGGVITASTFTVCYTAAAQGQPPVFFQDEATYGQAVAQAEATASAILDTEYSFDQDVTVHTAVAPRDKVEALPQVTDTLLSMIPELEHVYTLSVDGVLVGAAEDDDTISQALALVKEAYTTPETRSISFENQVTLRYQYLPADTGVSSAQELADLLMETSLQVFPYTVQPGDTLESVAEAFGMTQDRLLELNADQDILAQEDESDEAQLDATDSISDADTTDTTGAQEETARDSSEDDSSLSEVDLFLQELLGTPLQEGLTINVESLTPRLVVDTVEEQTLTRDISPERQDQSDSSMYAGEERIIQEGEVGQAQVLARVVTRAGVTVASTDLSSVTVTEATPLIVGVGTKAMPELSDGCLFQWPVQGTITSDYGYRFIFGETNFHRGVDIAASMGTAINAAMDGTVVFAGEKGSYGNLVILAHDNGFYTYYGHCSKLLVSQGQQVTQGQPIAAVGSTGRSTGPHCHFEVHYQSTLVDPLLYLPGSNNAPMRTSIPLDDQDLQESDKTAENQTNQTTQTETPTQTAPTQTAPSVQPAAPVQPETPSVTTPEEPDTPDEPEDDNDDSSSRVLQGSLSGFRTSAVQTQSDEEEDSADPAASID